MSSRRVELAVKRRRLQERCAAQRDAWSAAVGCCKPACGAVDRLRDGWSWLRRHPALPTFAVAAFVAARPRRAWHWAKNIWFFWLGLHRLQRAVGETLATSRSGR